MGGGKLCIRQMKVGTICPFRSVIVTQAGFHTESASHMYSIYSTGYPGMKKILSASDFPDAVICQTDAWAQGAIRACKDAGIDVPGDIAVAGFYNEPSSATGGLSLTSGATHPETAPPGFCGCANCFGAWLHCGPTVNAFLSVISA